MATTQWTTIIISGGSNNSSSIGKNSNDPPPPEKKKTTYVPLCISQLPLRLDQGYVTHSSQWAAGRSDVDHFQAEVLGENVSS